MLRFFKHQNQSLIEANLSSALVSELLIFNFFNFIFQFYSILVTKLHGFIQKKKKLSYLGILTTLNSCLELECGFTQPKGAFKYYISTFWGGWGRGVWPEMLILLMWLGGLEAKCLCKRSEFLSKWKWLLSLWNIT